MATVVSRNDVPSGLEDGVSVDILKGALPLRVLRRLNPALVEVVPEGKGEGGLLLACSLGDGVGKVDRQAPGDEQRR